MEKKNNKTKKFLEEFKKFISKGNVLDLAIAVIIGNSFNAIVTSLVNDVIMPLVGIIIGGIHFDTIKITVGEADIMVGSFIQHVVNFLIVAFTIFVVIKTFNKLNHRKEEKKELPKKTDDVILLEEIRDLLKTREK